MVIVTIGNNSSILESSEKSQVKYSSFHHLLNYVRVDRLPLLPFKILTNLQTVLKGPSIHTTQTTYKVKQRK